LSHIFEVLRGEWSLRPPPANPTEKAATVRAAGLDVIITMVEINGKTILKIGKQ